VACRVEVEEGAPRDHGAIVLKGACHAGLFVHGAETFAPGDSLASAGASRRAAPTALSAPRVVPSAVIPSPERPRPGGPPYADVSF